MSDLHVEEWRDKPFDWAEESEDIDVLVRCPTAPQVACIHVVLHYTCPCCYRVTESRKPPTGDSWRHI